jgi:phage tail-like protein
MPQTDATTYFILDSHQGAAANDGWRVVDNTLLNVTADGLSLAGKPSPPVPLKDAAGTFGGLENPTGVAVNIDGSIYVSDAASNRIFRLVRREGLKTTATFYQIAGAGFDKDRFVYVPLCNRLERWPATLRRDPQAPSEVELQCETVWSEVQARRLVESIIQGAAKVTSAATPNKQSCCGSNSSPTSNECDCPECSSPVVGVAPSIEKEWRDFYPSELLTQNLCQSSVEYLPCLGGNGREPRAFDQPRGLAISTAGDLYVADTQNHRVQVFALHGLALRKIWGKQATKKDVAQVSALDGCLPDEQKRTRLGQPIAGSRPGEFREPWDVIVDREGDCYIADKGNHRVQKYNCRTRKFEIIDGTILAAHFFQVLYGSAAGDRFVFIPARNRVEHWPSARVADPVKISDVAILSAGIAIVEAARQLVLKSIAAIGAEDILVEWDAAYPHNLAAQDPEPSFDQPVHLALDLSGSLFVVDESKDYVKVLDREGHVLGQISFVGDITGAFSPAAVLITPDGKLLVAGSGGIHRFSIDKGQWEYVDHYSAWSGQCTGLSAGAGSLVVTGSGVSGVALVAEQQQLEERGSLICGPLDSQIEKCQWHRFMLGLADGIPVGTSVTVSTYAAEDTLRDDDVKALADDEWNSVAANADDCLILSEPGRYLWLKIGLRGNGTDSPRLQRLKVYFPRLTYLEYLPAVYQADPVSKDFLERFLSIFERTLSGVEEEIDGIATLFDPDGVPAAGAPKDFLSWLASWIDMTFLPGWTTETRRRLLRNAPELYRKRGTPEGLSLLLKLALDLDVRILEHFKLRRWLFLAGQSALGGRAEVWGNCIVNRLQLDEYSRVGDFALIGTGDPERDPFFVYAHKFSVFVAAAQIRSPAVERMVRLLIDNEKPAHSQYTLETVEPRFRVGMQSTLGLDTQIGGYPRLVLNQCSTLGYDTLLGCDPQKDGPPIMQLDGQARVGINAVVG